MLNIGNAKRHAGNRNEGKKKDNESAGAQIIKKYSWCYLGQELGSGEGMDGVIGYHAASKVR
jgi:hypothetical protein